MSSIFGHGRLRLYLLKLLDEKPRHGYDVIRRLQDRFLGVYAPSAGTVYPRLARLEEEGLVTHDQEGGRKVYRLTDAGREELRRREDELSELERDIAASVRELAGEVSEDVRRSVRGLREDLKHATRQTQRSGWDPDSWRTVWRDVWQGTQGAGDGHADGPAGEHGDGDGAASDPAARELDEHIDRFAREARDAAQRGHVDDAALDASRTILDNALTALRATVSGRPG